MMHLKAPALAALLAAACAPWPAASQAPQPASAATTPSTAASPASQGSKQPSSPAAGATAAPGAPHKYLPERFAGRAGKYYRLVWGVDELSVKWAESGEVIRFSYKVLDPAKARALNEKTNQPTLADPKAGVQLVVPQMENIGQLRQSSAPEAGRSYWIAFSNKGRLVKRGDRVIVQIGPFKADGLVVD